MAQEFRTTFMPSSSATQAGGFSGGGIKKVKAGGIAHRTVSVLGVLSTLIFFVGVVGIGGTFFYEKLLLNQIEQKTKSLEASERQFESSFIQELKSLDQRMKISTRLLREHLSTAPFFEQLGELTLRSVQYDTFTFKNDENIPVVETKGKALDYESIAQQSEVFSDSRYVENHIFSNLGREDDGRIGFSLTMQPSDEVILFEKSLEIFGQKNFQDVLQAASQESANTKAINF